MLQPYKPKLITFSKVLLLIVGFHLKSFSQKPNITSVSPNPVCQGDSVTLSGTGFTKASSVMLGTLAATSFKVKDDQTIVAFVDKNAKSANATVTGPNGTSDDFAITIQQAPQPDLADVSPGVDIPFTNCDGNSTYQLVVKNIAANTEANSVYDINWGDGSAHFNQTDWSAGATTAHTYNGQGYFKITFKITPANGCTRTKTINFYNGVNPLASFTTTAPTTGLCVPATVNFSIGNWFNNSTGTTYQLDFGDGSPVVTLTHPLNATNIDQIVSHVYTKSSCPNVDFTATLRATNGCFTTTYTLNQIVIREKPKADFIWDPDPACVTDPVCFTNQTTDGYSGTSCSTIASYLWDFGDNTTSTDKNPACHQYASPGTYTVKLSATNTACGEDAISKQVVVEPTSSQPTAAPVTYCQNEMASPLSATGTNLLWYTTATGGTGSSTAPTPNTSTPGTTTYYVSQTLNGQCESPRVAVTVTVYAIPSKPVVTSPVQLCKGKPASQLTATGSNLLWYTTASGGTGSATGPTPNTSTVGTTLYYVSQTTNGCEGPRASIEVDVSDTPAIPTVTTPVTYCQDQPASQLTAAGTGLLWYTVATGGTGTSAAPTPVTSTPGTTYYYVSSSNYCGESGRAKIEVDVFAGPSATISYNKNVLCNSVDNAGNPNPPVAVIFTGNSGGTFSVSPSSGLPINASTGTIIPSGATAGTYTVQYLIKGSGGCADFITTTTVTITSAPTATIKYHPICSSDGKINVAITGTTGGTFTSGGGLSIDATTGAINPAGSTPGNYVVTYTVPASAPCPAFTTTAAVTITQAPAASISYSKPNLCNDNNSTTNPPVNVTQTGTTGGTYSISPSTGLPLDASTGTISPSGATEGTYTVQYLIKGSGGCADFVTTTTVTITSAPTATIKYPAICSSDGKTNVTITGTTGGTFTSDAGLSIDATTGVINPAGSTPGNYVVTYTIPPSAPCPGFTTTTAITITQAPAANISYSKPSLCNDNNSTTNPPVNVTQTGTTGGTYSISPSAGLPIDASTGTITPSGAQAGTYIITYTIAAGGGCAVYTATTTVVVNSAPTATIDYAGAPFCSGSDSPQKITITGTQGGTFSSTPGLSLDVNTGDINPSLSQPGTYTVTYTIAPSSPCPGYTTSTSVTINESPVISFNQTSQSVCSAMPAVFIPASTVSTTVYNWSVKGSLPANVSGVTSGTTSGPNAAINLLFTNTGTVSEKIIIEVASVNPTSIPCSGVPYDLTLTVNPIPSKLAADTTEFCMHAPSMALTANADAGNTVKWYDNNNVLLSQPPVIDTKDPATFQFYATQTNVYGCESPASEFIAIVHPVAHIVSSSYTNPTLCGVPSGSVVLNVVDLNGNDIPDLPVIVHYTKFQTDYSLADSTDASGRIVVPLTAGTYSDFYVETSGCFSQKIPDVYILKDPDPPSQPVAGYNPPLCSETTLRLSAVSATGSQNGPLQYVWVGPAFGPFADTVSNTFISFPSAGVFDAGTYIVYAIQNNCISSPTSFQVIIKQSPSKPVINTRTPLCVGDELFLQATSSFPGGNSVLNYSWTGPGTGFPVYSPNAGINNVKLQDAGVYTITVTSPQTGCSSSTDTLIQIGGYPVVKFAQDSLTLPTGFLLNLDPVITNSAEPGILPMKSYEWTPSQDLACNDAICSLPVATIKNDVCYTVKATNIYGCSGTDDICIRVFCKSSQIFIPNAFTPNGGLQENLKFMVRASGISTIKSFRVFNRWGRIVFERDNFPPNDPSFGWDGRFNGKLADRGVYIYTVEAVCDNGVSYVFKGNVTLL